MVYFVRKIGFFILTLWAAITLNFIIPRIQGGDPAEAIVRRLVGQNQALDPNQVEAVRKLLGTPDDNYLVQYIDYWRTLLQGDFGVSYSYLPYTVTHMIGQALPWTIFLVGTVHVLAFVIGTLLGTWAAYRRNGAFDSFMSTFAGFFGAIPFFWVALLLLYVFAFQLGWFPDGGGYAGSTPPGWNWEFMVSALKHVALPALSMLITAPIGWILGMRNTMVQELGSDYTRLAKAKGLSDARIALMYGARNAILPNFTGFALGLGSIVGGSLIVEQIYNYPGMGRLMFESISNRDFPLMQTIFLFTTVGVLTANFLTDLLYGVIDPRVRRGATN
jgi:peptide/nickel transport system permease protein